jgi:hypothetical protein
LPVVPLCCCLVLSPVVVVVVVVQGSGSFVLSSAWAVRLAVISVTTLRGKAWIFWRKGIICITPGSSFVLEK